MNGTTALMIHCSRVITGELLAASVLAIILFAMVSYREHRRSTAMLSLAIAFQFMFLLGDAAAFYDLSGGSLPGWALHIAYFVAYTFGHLVPMFFGLYVMAYIQEKTTVRRWAYLIPVALSAIETAVVAVAILLGTIYTEVDGRITVTGSTPTITIILQSIVTVYYPIAAFAKRKHIGLKAVLLMGLFGLLPVGIAYLSYDYTAMACAWALIMVYVLLQCDTSAEKEARARELERLNTQLEESSAEQEAQIEEIRALNAQLEESVAEQEAQQAQLEETSAEQEAQIEEIRALNAKLEETSAEQEAHIEEIRALNAHLEETSAEQEAHIEEIRALNAKLEESSADQEAKIQEITALNSELLEQKERLSEVYGMVEGFSRDYHSVWLIDVETRRMRMIRADGASVIKDAVQMAVQEPRLDTVAEQYISAYVMPEDRDRMRAEMEFANILKQLEENGLYTSTYLRRAEDGSVGYHQIAFANADSEGGKRRILFGFRDVDARVRAEEAYKQELREARSAADAANKAKSVFLFNMSHDIRTPMNAILGFTQLLRKEETLSDRQRDYVRKIGNSGQYLLSVINNVLDMARIESGKLELDEVFADLLDEDNKVDAMLTEELAKKQLTYTSSIDVRHRYVFADMAKTKQVTMNLLSNAIKYTPAGGRIHCDFSEVDCEREGYARFVTTISDTGIGMSSEFVEHIFDAFTREKTTTENKVVGTGLGMAIVKRLVDLMGGTIEIRSEQGKGSTFIITIDFRIVEHPELFVEKKAQAHEGVVELAGKRILLAEDNELNAEIAGMILEETGAMVEHAADGVICVDMLERAEPGYYDLVLMDIQMPNMNGYEAAKRIRRLADPAKANIPIIAMTANAFDEDRRRAFDAGMNGHLGKPIDVPALMKALGEYLG